MSGKALAHLRQQWMGAIALFCVLTGGTAYALDGSNTVFSDDIVAGEVKASDLGTDAVTAAKILNGQVKGADIADGSVQAPEIAAGAVRTAEIADGQVRAEDLAPAATGARAWAKVDRSGNLLRSKNVTSVTVPDTPTDNQYCIDPGAGINSTAAVLLVTETRPEGSTTDAYNDVSHVVWNSESSACPGGTMEVVTYVGSAEAALGGPMDIGGFKVIPSPQGFTFAIP